MRIRMFLLLVAIFAVSVNASAQFGKFKGPTVAAPSKEEIETKGLWKALKGKIDDLIEKLKAVAEEQSKALAGKLAKRLEVHVGKIDVAVDKKQWPSAKKLIEAGTKLLADVANDAKGILIAKVEGAGEELQVAGLWKVLKAAFDQMLAKLKGLGGDLAKEPIGKIEAHTGKIDAAIGDKKWPDAKALIDKGMKLVAELGSDVKEMVEKAAKAAGEGAVVTGLWMPLKPKTVDLLTQLKAIPTDDAKEFVGKIEPFVVKIDSAIDAKSWKDAREWLEKLADVAKDAGVEVAKAAANKLLIDFIKGATAGLRKKAEAFAERVRASADEKVKKWLKEVDELYKEAEEYAAKGKEKAKKRLAEVEEKLRDIEERLRKQALDKLEDVEKGMKERLAEFEAKVNAVKETADSKAKELRDQAYAAIAEAEKLAKDSKDAAKAKLKEAEELVGKAVARGQAAVEAVKGAVLKIQAEVSGKLLAEKQRVEKWAERVKSSVDERAKAAMAEWNELQKRAEELVQKGAEEARDVARKVVEKGKEIEKLARELGAKAMGFAKERYEAAQKGIAELRGAADAKAKALAEAAEELVRQAEDAAGRAKDEADGLLKMAEAKVAEGAAHLKKFAHAVKGAAEAVFGSAREALGKLREALGADEAVLANAKDKRLKKLVKSWAQLVKTGDETASWQAIGTLNEIVAAAATANIVLPEKFVAVWSGLKDASQKEIEVRLGNAGEKAAWLDELLGKVKDRKVLQAIKKCKKVVVSFRAKVGLGNLKGWGDWAKAEKCLETVKALAP